jgi:UDP-N-acetylglucosamine 2-epimerase (hydrolysing)
VAHIEGGELSGTIDESIRHSISKLAHIHFVANTESKKRLIQMGENKNNIYVIGSPDIDVMLSKKLPDLASVKKYYQINFDKYGIFLFHPVTTELRTLKKRVRDIMQCLINSNKQYVVIYPNNDEGSDIIIKEIEKLRNNKNFRIFPSIRFEKFLTLLKNASFIIGNSSSGIREAEVYGVPCINIGTRQNNRSGNKNIIHASTSKEIIAAIANVENIKLKPLLNFGIGSSSEKFFEILNSDKLFEVNIQKIFFDID